VSCLLSKNLDTIFEDPKRIIAKTNLTFLHNTYCVKNIFLWSICPTCKLFGYTKSTPLLFPKHASQHFFNKIKNKPKRTCGNPWLPLDLNYATKSMPYSNTIYKVVVESWYCQDIKDLWENCNGIKEGKGM